MVNHGITPNACYAQSPFLFWTIVGIGCRRYPNDPTMLGRLAPNITNLALLSLSSRAAPILIIQGLLLLCTWPGPVDTLGKDVGYVLSGIALNLAMRAGLHVFGNGQDFARTKLDPNEEHTAMRARLWFHCLVVCQRYFRTSTTLTTLTEVFIVRAVLKAYLHPPSLIPLIWIKATRR